MSAAAGNAGLIAAVCKRCGGQRLHITLVNWFGWPRWVCLTCYPRKARGIPWRTDLRQCRQCSCDTEHWAVPEQPQSALGDGSFNTWGYYGLNAWLRKSALALDFAREAGRLWQNRFATFHCRHCGTVNRAAARKPIGL